MKSWSGTFAALLLLPGLALAAPEVILDPQRIGWSQANLKATRLFMSMRADIRIDERNGSDIDEQLIEPGEGVPVTAEDSVVDLNYQTSGLGRRTEVSLLVDPITALAIQRVSTDSGNKQRHRVYRFTDAGAYHKTRWPESGEEELDISEWSERTEGLRPYPESVRGAMITESSALIYVAAAAPLNEPGDTFEILTYARRHVHRVTLEVAEAEVSQFVYQEVSDGKNQARSEKVTPIRILIRGAAVDDGDDEDEFDLLGLRGDIELLLEPETRLPLRLSGNVKIVGRVKFLLQKGILN